MLLCIPYKSADVLSRNLSSINFVISSRVESRSVPDSFRLGLVGILPSLEGVLINWLIPGFITPIGLLFGGCLYMFLFSSSIKLRSPGNSTCMVVPIRVSVNGHREEETPENLGVSRLTQRIFRIIQTLVSFI